LVWQIFRSSGKVLPDPSRNCHQAPAPDVAGFQAALIPGIAPRCYTARCGGRRAGQSAASIHRRPCTVIIKAATYLVSVSWQPSEWKHQSL
jgi:hypothetical protein